MSTPSMPPAASSDGGNRNPVDVLAESFLARLREGEYPAISEYAEAHPDLADEIRAVFPTLAMLEKGGDGLSYPQSPLRSKIPAQIGEYVILREIGRGGMGIVFEAEHNTMRRRVALKLLPVSSATDEVHLKRFYVEARVAGRLHHSHIVPVFEVGTVDGYHYYAMQLIQGQSLDVVIAELRQLRWPTDAQPRQPVGDSTATMGKSLAAGLMTGPASLGTEGSTSEGSTLGDIDTGSQGPADTRADTTGVAVDWNHSSTWSHSSTDRDDYFRRVARIGLQVAEALSHAHGQGILHRDIKPSNVILDTNGVAWVADFGLAKTDDGDLTQSGDLVGTFRYMAPERFQGAQDARSDLYGLGLTLYELCTLEPAFRGTDRAQLVRDICHGAPPNPRSVNRQLPRDLETILLKAMERRPAHRYQAARHMAEDLRLFLDDLPIKARRSSVLERTWRWCRRNPEQAVLCACVAMLLCIITCGSLAFAYFADRKATELAESQRVATHRLYESLRGSAEASRYSGRVGQHFSSLADVEAATEILSQLSWDAERKRAEQAELRNAAIAAMPLPDVRADRSWSRDEGLSSHVAFDVAGERYARPDARGSLAVHFLADDSLQCRFPKPDPAAQPFWLDFSPDGRYVGVAYVTTSGRVFQVLDTRLGEVSFSTTQSGQPLFHCDFATQSDWCVLALGTRLKVVSLPQGRTVQEMPLGRQVRALDVEPVSGRIAVLLSDNKTIRFYQHDSATAEAETTLEQAVMFLRWHPQLPQLGIGDFDGDLWLAQVHVEGDTIALDKVRDFSGHSGRITNLHFSPRGEQLISNAWDGTTRLWDVSSGKQMLRIERWHLLASGFSGDGRYIGMVDANQVRRCEVARKNPLLVLNSPQSTQRRWSVSFDPSGRWLASAKNDGVEIWDAQRGTVVDFVARPALHKGASKDAEFLPSGDRLLVSTDRGVERFDVRHLDEALQLHSPEMLYPHAAAWCSLDASGSTVAMRASMGASRGVVLSLEDPTQKVTLGPHTRLDHLELSPDGRWAASSTWGGRGILVWNAKTGEPIRKEPFEPLATKTNAVFSPDSRLLFISTEEHYAAYEMDGLRLRYRHARTHIDGWPGPLAFSPDGSLVAMARSRFVMALVDAQRGEEIASLNVPSEAGFHCCDFSPCGTRLAAASDTTIHLWDLRVIKQQLGDLGLGF